MGRLLKIFVAQHITHTSVFLSTQQINARTYTYKKKWYTAKIRENDMRTKGSWVTINRPHHMIDHAIRSQLRYKFYVVQCDFN